MIRIARGPEPAELLPVRASELSRVRALVSAGPLNKDVVGSAYAAFKDVLWKQQSMRCCYCERPYMECSFNDVEHFRPKASADRLDGTVHAGYWWLAWTWENLLFSCPNCNRSAKNDAFPLEPGCVPLAVEEQPPGKERPSLIDPCEEDPVLSIQFVLKGGHWRPVGRNGSTRGERTVEVLKLDRADLLTLYTTHVEDQVQPRVEATQEAMARGEPQLIESAWRRVRGLLTPRMPFVALSYDAIDHFVPEQVRVQWGLVLPWPPVRGP